VDNSGENQPPEPEKPTSENPASLTSTNNQLIQALQRHPSSVETSPVQNGASGAGTPPAGLAALADVEPAPLALHSTDAIARCSRLEPAVQMFALRSHLAQVLGSQPSFTTIADWVTDASLASPPSLRGRLRTADVLGWVLAFHPDLNPGPPSGGPDPSGRTPARPPAASRPHQPAPRASTEDQPRRNLRAAPSPSNPANR